MARLIVALIRHGDYAQLPDTPSAHQPFGLTEKGCKQAQEAAVEIEKLLQQERWQLHHEIICSHLLRAWQTAQKLSQKLSESLAHGFTQPPQLSETPALAERGLGIAGNLTTKQIEAVIAQDPRYPTPPKDWKSNSHYQLPLPGAESLLQAGQRVASYIQDRTETLAQQVQVDTLQLFVGHGAAFRHCAHHLGVLPFEEIAKLSMYHAQPVYLEYEAGGHWSHIAGKWKLRPNHSDYND